MTLSVVIPTLNEAGHIQATLARVHQQAGPFEVVVVDGGSTDATRTMAGQQARVISASRGRARQLNAGASETTGDVLLFLHADTLLPDGAFDIVQEALSDPIVKGGCFRLRFDVQGPAYWFYSQCTGLRWHRMVFGDRALFVRRTCFEQAGQFPDQPIFEDLDFFHSLHRLPGRLAYLPQFVTTSARRFTSQGAIRQQTRNVMLWSLHNLGVSPAYLQRFYSYS